MARPRAAIGRGAAHVRPASLGAPVRHRGPQRCAALLRGKDSARARKSGAGILCTDQARRRPARGGAPVAQVEIARAPQGAAPSTARTVPGARHTRAPPRPKRARLKPSPRRYPGCRSPLHRSGAGPPMGARTASTFVPCSGDREQERACPRGSLLARPPRPGAGHWFPHGGDDTVPLPCVTVSYRQARHHIALWGNSAPTGQTLPQSESLRGAVHHEGRLWPRWRAVGDAPAGGGAPLTAPALAGSAGAVPAQRRSLPCPLTGDPPPSCRPRGHQAREHPYQV